MRFQFLRRQDALLLLGSVLLGSVASPSCSSNCTEQSVYGLNIRVADKASGTAICDAVVIATDGKYSEKLLQHGAPDCVYVGAGERAGTYNVTAARDGYVANGVQVRVTEDECHVVGQTATITLAAGTSECSPGDVVACACGDGGVQGTRQCGADGKFGSCDGC